jgi:bacteriocin-like protein
MSNDKSDPKKKDPQISSADDLTKTTKKGDVELTEEELKRVSGGGLNIKTNIKGETTTDGSSKWIEL